MKSVVLKCLTAVLFSAAFIVAAYHLAYAWQMAWSRAAEREQQRINDTINPTTEEYRKKTEEIWHGKSHWGNADPSRSK